MTEEQEKAAREYAEARRVVGQQLVGKPGNRAEGILGQTYQRMVVLGLAPQIKAKYRVQKKYR